MACEDAKPLAPNFGSAFKTVAGIDDRPVDVYVCDQYFEVAADDFNGRRLGESGPAEEDHRRLSSVSNAVIKTEAVFTGPNASSAAESVKTTLVQTVGTSRDSLQASFGAAAGVTVASAPVIEQSVAVLVVNISTSPPASPPPVEASVSVGVIVASIISGVAALILVVGCAFVIRMRAKNRAAMIGIHGRVGANGEPFTTPSPVVVFQA